MPDPITTRSQSRQVAYRTPLLCVTCHLCVSVNLCQKKSVFKTSYYSHLQRLKVQSTNLKKISLGKVRKGYWSQI